MARFAYSLLFTVLLPIMVIRLLVRSLRNPPYRQRMLERFGHVPKRPPPGGIWVHSVSVGETIAAQPMIERLLEQHPGRPIIVTTTTPTGSAQVTRLFGDRVYHSYLPYDLPWLHSRFRAATHPAMLIIMETELWPNLLAHCNKHGIPTLLANARLSEKSARGYQAFSALTRPMLQHLNAIAVQASSDGSRFKALGYPAERITETGSIKFDISVPGHTHEKGTALKQEWGEKRPVLVLASSHAGEDELLLDCYPRLAAATKGLLLMIVPRHPERFDVVARAIAQRGLSFHRRSDGPIQPSHAEALQVYLADSMGEMMLLLSASDVVVMGGSFEPVGGHNPIEPAFLGKPVIMGPHYKNFATIVNNLAVRGALKVSDHTHLNQDVSTILCDERLQNIMAKAAVSAVSAHRGAIDRLGQVIEQTLHNTA